MSDRTLWQADRATGRRCLRRSRLDSGHTLFASGRTPATVRQGVADRLQPHLDTKTSRIQA